MYAGEVLLGIESLTGNCTQGRVFPLDDHTWNTTGITGIGVGATDFSIQWQNEGSDFPWTQQDGAHANIC